MKWEADKTMDRVAFGKMLINLGSEILAGDEISLKKDVVAFPDKLDVSLALDSEQQGFEMICSWKKSAQPKSASAKRKAKPNKEELVRLSKENKQSLAKVWGIIMDELSAKRLPSAKLIANFMDLNREFAALAPSKWKKEIAVYKKSVEKFVAAVESGDIANAKQTAYFIEHLQSACHKHFGADIAK